jgi:hypothetical protein
MYLMDADSGTAMWASDDQRLAPWTAAYVPKANGNPEAPFPLPYGNTPRWLAPAEQLPVSPPRIDFLESRSDGDATLVKAQVTSPRRGQVITLNTNRPVQNTIITADGEPPATASPSYPDDAGTRPWPYELRFYDLRRTGSSQRCDFPVPDFLGSTSATTPWAWNRYPGSRRGQLILRDRQPTTPTSLSLAAASNHDQRRFAASRGWVAAARASSGPWRREPPPAG